MSRPCTERAGFLFDHDCTQPASGACGDCQQQVCAAHLHAFGPDRLCTSCARALMREAEGRHRYGALSQEPVFYALSRYPGFGAYPEGSWGHDLLEPSSPGDA